MLAYDVARRPGSGAARLALAKAHIGTGTLDSARAQLAEARKAVEDTVPAGVVDWNLDYVRAMTDAFPVSETDLQRLVGDYGPRHFRIQDGALHYLRDSGRYADYRELVPLSRDTFFIRGLSSFRMTFEFDGNGNAVKVVGTYEGGGRDESARSR